MALPIHVTVAGSYRKHFSAISQARQHFLDHDCVVLRPNTDELAPDNPTDQTRRLVGDPTDEGATAAAQRRAIAGSDILYVVNPGGYVGPSAIAEMGYAYALGVLVTTAEPAYERAAADLVAYTGGVLGALDFVPVDAQELPVLERRLCGSLGRHNIAPWLSAHTDWERATNGEWTTITYQQHILAQHQKGNPWKIVGNSVAAKALLATLGSYGQPAVTVDKI